MSDCSTNAFKTKIPKIRGNCCKPGTFMCEQPVLYPLGRNRLIYVDRCMIPELQSLWNRDIETGGCCCGHFEKDGFIQVFPEHMDAMRQLGYEEIPPIEVNGQLMGECAFKPKTVLEFNGYCETKTELEERYEQLAEITNHLYSENWSLLYSTIVGIYTEWDADKCEQATNDELLEYRELLEELGVNLDD